MAENKMLIDATHPEETRVVVLREGRVEEFDYESAARKLLRGSIFLAKITRVEPSLQAAFVDYGGNRHGFLAFNEIHPDYYQIPHSDRQALIEEELANRFDDSDDDDDDHEVGRDDNSDPPPDAYEAGGDDDDGAQVHADDVHDDDENDRGHDEDDDHDFEAHAIDVSELLPPDADSNATEVSAGTEVADREPTATASTDVSDAGEEDSDSGDDKPRTIAAAISPEERIVGEVADTTEDAGTDADGASSEILAESEGTDAGGIVSEQETQVAASDEADAAETQINADARDDAPSAVDHDVDATDQDAAVRESDVEQEAADRSPAPSDDGHEDARADDEEAEQVEEVGAGRDALEEVPVRRRRRARSYKIQEVIKRRQVVLVQVVKEERGNKGAALTTYLSLAGRYTVLMPNTARGGGISRKITNLQDRKRLKAIAQELDVPEGMGLIIRTAGAARTKQEIKRDFEYLLRLWENVRDLTLQSTAPSLVYEEGDLIKRSIRDLYSKDIDQIVVAGEEAHKEAKSFMRMLMPSHAKNVVKYDEPQPLFARYRIEQQLNAMFSPFVQLKSGGYLVINQTEALVAVDVNSGKSTRKFSIEDTALNTNLEAAEELTRQLKLRDLAGLIVIDFIDMEEKRNNRAVERRLKECLRDDRARIQVGRISHFGLLEMSRQRLRTGVLEGSTMPCQHCQGTGIIRSTESVALAVLRSLEDHLMGTSPRPLVAHCSREAAMYLLNHKRHFVLDMEARYGVSIHIIASDDQQGADFVIERLNGATAPAPSRRPERAAVNVEAGFAEEEVEDVRAAAASEDGERRPRRRRRRRGRRGDGETGGDELETNLSSGDEAEPTGEDPVAADGDETDGDERSSRRRRRGRRGGRRNRGERSGSSGDVAEPGAPQPEIEAVDSGWPSEPQAAAHVDADTDDQDGETPAVSHGDEPSSTEAIDAMAADIDVVQAAAAPDADMPASQTAQASAAETEVSGDEPATAGADEQSKPAVEDQAEAEAEPVGSVVQAAADDEPRLQEPQPDDAVSESAPVSHDAAVTENPAEPVQEERSEPARAPRGEPVSSAPVLERVVISPQDGSSGEAPQDSQPPAKKGGWWQRRFGS
jgi:ribonuclease E